MREFWTGVVVLGVGLLATAGCATRDWVREYVGKKEVEIDQRFASGEKRAADEAQRVEGLGVQLKTVEASLTETSEVARAARERADTAQARAEDAAGRLSRAWAGRFKRDPVETIDVLFAFDRWDLSDAAQTALASIAKELQANPRLSVDLEGYADPRGTFDYNVALSQRRVEAVRRFLVEKGIELPRINAVGLGPIMTAGLPDQKKRRVTVRLMAQAD